MQAKRIKLDLDQTYSRVSKIQLPTSEVVGPLKRPWVTIHSIIAFLQTHPTHNFSLLGISCPENNNKSNTAKYKNLLYLTLFGRVSDDRIRWPHWAYHIRVCGFWTWDSSWRRYEHVRSTVLLCEGWLRWWRYNNALSAIQCWETNHMCRLLQIEFIVMVHWNTKYNI